MASLLENWRFQCVDTLPFMEYQNGDRVKHFLGSVGAVEGYDFYSPGYFYVLWDGNEVSSRIPPGSLEKIDD